MGTRFEVHNGKSLVPVLVTEEMVGRKFGEFAHTRFVYTTKVKAAPKVPVKKGR